MCAVVLGELPFQTHGKALSSVHLIALYPRQQSAVSLSELLAKHERIILDFVSARCQHSCAQLASIKSALRRKGRDARVGGDFSVLAIVFVGKSLSEIRRFLKSEALPVLVLWDKEGKLAQSLEIKATPTIAVLSRDYRLLMSYEGFLPHNSKRYREFFERLMKAVTQGNPLPPRPVEFSFGDSGCSPSG